MYSEFLLLAEDNSKEIKFCFVLFSLLWVLCFIVFFGFGFGGETVDFSGRRENSFTFCLFLTHIHRIKILCCSTTRELILTELHGIKVHSVGLGISV